MRQSSINIDQNAKITNYAGQIGLLLHPKYDLYRVIWCTDIARQSCRWENNAPVEIKYTVSAFPWLSKMLNQVHCQLVMNLITALMTYLPDKVYGD